jgi:hypothetical protein
MKQIISLLAVFMLLTVGMASAKTETDISFYQADGNANVQTYAQVEGNFWDYPAAPVPQTMTAFVQTDIENDGSFNFQQKIIQYGNGAQYPNGEAIGEWSMKEDQRLSGAGETEYNKHFDVWTVHTGWNTDYVGGGEWNMPEGLDTYAFDGDTQSTSHTQFNYHVATDSSFAATSGVWVNPFTVVQ